MNDKTVLEVVLSVINNGDCPLSFYLNLGLSGFFLLSESMPFLSKIKSNGLLDFILLTPISADVRHKAASPGPRCSPPALGVPRGLELHRACITGTHLGC